jgi:hypothetical protein
MDGEIWFDDLIESVKAFDVEENIEEAVNDDPEAITMYNKQQLYNEGMGSNGSKIREYADARKTRGYSEVKNRMNPNPGYGTPDIFFTGETYREMFAKMNKNELIISSLTPQTPKLEADRPNIFGLTNESEDKAAEDVIEPALQNKLVEKVGVELI